MKKQSRIRIEDKEEDFLSSGNFITDSKYTVKAVFHAESPPRLFWLKLARGGGVVLVPPGNVSSCKCFKDYLLWFNNASRLVGTSHETLKFLINHLGGMSSSVGWELAWKNGKLALNILRGWSRIVRVPFCVTLERVVGKLSTALMTVKVDEREKREDRSERTMKVFKAEWN